MDEYNNHVKNMAKSHHNNSYGNSHYAGYRPDSHANNSLSGNDSIVFIIDIINFYLNYLIGA